MTSERIIWLSVQENQGTNSLLRHTTSSIMSSYVCNIVLIVVVIFAIERRLAFSEEDNGSLKKIAKLKNPAEYSRQGLAVRSFYFSRLWLIASSPTHMF